MGSSSRQTVGYWYRMLLHFGLCRAPIDALLEMRVADRVAWSGTLTTSGMLAIDALELFGGESSEGGIAGDLAVMMGEADQLPNAYLVGQLGAQQGAYRGKVTLAWQGGVWGAMNPYPKAAAFKVRRASTDDAWYPERAAIAMGVYDEMPLLDEAVELTWPELSEGSPGYPGPGGVHPTLHSLGPWPFEVELRVAAAGATADDQFVVDGETAVPGHPPAEALAEGTVVATIPAGTTVQLGVMNLFHPYCSGEGSFRLVHVTGTKQTLAINPAHLLRDSIVAQDMLGEPAGVVDDASFEAAADTLFAEGFGLCTTYDAISETIDAFQQRICNVIGAALSRDRRTGLWTLDLLRGGGDPASLPVLTDDDILDYASEPGTLDDAVNQVVVEWFDPVLKEQRSTAPVQALGLIQGLGGVVSETAQYPEIPTEALALRAAARDLRHRATPLRRFELKTTRVAFAWRAGTYFRLQTPKRGIADMVCLIGEIDVGTLRQGAISIKAVQDVFSLPSAVYVVPQAPPASSTEPTAPVYQRLMEVPYAELARRLGAAELAALDAQAGYIAVVASRPPGGWNYSLSTAAEGEPLAERGNGDWTPVCIATAAAGALDTSLEIGASIDLAALATPLAAAWDDEIVRIDAIDLSAGTLTLGRGCADTTPVEHAAGSVLYLYGVQAGTDGREYVENETVSAKVLTRAAGGKLASWAAPELHCQLVARAARPYPPGDVRINGEPDPVAIVSDVLTISWAHRDRVQQADALVDTTMGSIGPEDGTEYEAWLYDDITDDLLANAILVGTEWQPVIAGAHDLRLEIAASRGGLQSWQRQVRRFGFVGGSILLTEDGELVLTEDDELIEVEDQFTDLFHPWNGVLVEGAGLLLAWGSAAEAGVQILALSSDGGQSFSVDWAFAGQVSLGGQMAVAALNSGVYMHTLVSFASITAASWAARLIGDLTELPGEAPVIAVNETGTENPLYLGYPRTGDGSVVNLLALWSDGTTFYGVGYYLNPALSQAVRLYTSGASGVLTEVGPMTQDPADPNMLPATPWSPAAWGQFIIGQIPGPQAGQGGLRKIGSRWWLVSTRAAYFNDGDGTSGWRRAALGFGEEEHHSTERLISGPLDLGSGVLVMLDREPRTLKCVSVSHDAGDTWEASQPPGPGPEAGGAYRAERGVVVGGVALSYPLWQAVALRLAAPYTDWTVEPVVGLPEGYVVSQAFGTSTGVVVMAHLPSAMFGHRRVLLHSTDGVTFVPCALSAFT